MISPDPPLPNSYWVYPGQLLAGEYPGAPRGDTRKRLQRLLAAGINYFVDLTMPDEIPPYAQDLPPNVQHHRMPIFDHDVPMKPEQMVEILRAIKAALNLDKRVYVHCRAGIGRTGTVIGCLLSDSGVSGDDALYELNRMWQQCARSKSWNKVPETDEQVEYVRRWDRLLYPAKLDDVAPRAGRPRANVPRGVRGVTDPGPMILPTSPVVNSPAPSGIARPAGIRDAGSAASVLGSSLPVNTSGSAGAPARGPLTTDGAGVSALSLSASRPSSAESAAAVDTAGLGSFSAGAPMAPRPASSATGARGAKGVPSASDAPGASGVARVSGMPDVPGASGAVGSSDVSGTSGVLSASGPISAPDLPGVAATSGATRVMGQGPAGARASVQGSSSDATAGARGQPLSTGASGAVRGLSAGVSAFPTPGAPLEALSPKPAVIEPPVQPRQGGYVHTPGLVQQPARSMRERYLGALIGLAVGDALGATHQQQPRGSFEPISDLTGGGVLNLPRGAWTDDTAMALCLAESLLESRGFDARDQVERYAKWQQGGYMSATGEAVGITPNTARSIAVAQWRRQLFAGSHDPKLVEPSPLSRMAPPVMFYLLFKEQALEFAGDSVRTTSQAPLVLNVSRLFAAMLYAALQGQPKPQVVAPPWDLPADRPKSRIRGLIEGRYRAKDPAVIKAGNHIIDTLEFVLWAFDRTDSFADGALLVANGGENSDVAGAVYGQLAGAYYGVEAIPAAWRNSLIKKDLIESLALRLLDQTKVG